MRSDERVRSTFELLVVEHHVQVRAFVRSLGVDPDWVDDIAQEAFLTAYREWKTFDSTRDFGKWLRGIAANIVRNELRKDARRQRILRSELVELFIERAAVSREHPEPITQHRPSAAMPQNFSGSRRESASSPTLSVHSAMPTC